MTKNSYLKSEIRARMERTGERYSVAASAIAQAPVATGFAELDAALAGGLGRQQISLILSRGLAEPTMLMPDLLRRLMAPNRRVLVVSSEGSELVRILSQSAQAEDLSAEQTDLHIGKNLTILSADCAQTEIRDELSEGNYGAILIDENSRAQFRRSVIGHAEYPEWDDLNELRSRAMELNIPAVLFKRVPETLVGTSEGWPAGPWLSSTILTNCALAVEIGSNSDGSVGFVLRKNRYGENGLSGTIEL